MVSLQSCLQFFIPLSLLLLQLQSRSVDAFSISSLQQQQRHAATHLSVATPEFSEDDTLSRRNMLHFAILATTGITLTNSPVAWAAERPSLDQCLYTILRVREATEQESRLIKTGKFKDVQRANIKLAVKFMVENYRLSDAFVAASAYLDGNDRRIQAGQIGQTAVQNLITILEYFDSADVQNLRVGSDSLGGKQELVLKGLEATRKAIDDFLAYFPAESVGKAKAKVAEENALNEKEFDKSLGNILNLPTKT